MRRPTTANSHDSIILNDEDRRAVAAVQRVLADHETQLIATGLTRRQLAIVERMRHYRAHLDFINAPSPELAEGAPSLSHRELEAFAEWVHTQGYRSGIKAMLPGATDEQISAPYMGHFFFNILDRWRAERQAQETA